MMATCSNVPTNVNERAITYNDKIDDLLTKEKEREIIFKII